MVPIPYALSYHTTAKGRIPKVVPCEECGFEYVYLLNATAQGEGTSLFFLDNDGARRRSQAAAEADLAASLEVGCAVVPCPECGHVQQHMIPQARLLHRQWMRKPWPFLLAGGIALTVLGFALGGEWQVRQPILGAIWAVAGLLVGLGVSLPLLRSYLSQRYDPNADPVEKRKQLGQELAVSKEVFLQVAPGELEAQVFSGEVAATRTLWTVRDTGGFLTLVTPSGRRAQPFWSSRARVEQVVLSVPAYSGCEPYEVSWDDFRANWVSGLAGNGLLVGANWSDEPAAGHEMEPERLVLRVQAVIDNRLVAEEK